MEPASPLYTGLPWVSSVALAASQDGALSPPRGPDLPGGAGTPSPAVPLQSRGSPPPSDSSPSPGLQPQIQLLGPNRACTPGPLQVLRPSRCSFSVAGMVIEDPVAWAFRVPRGRILHSGAQPASRAPWGSISLPQPPQLLPHCLGAVSWLTWHREACGQPFASCFPGGDYIRAFEA